MSRVPASAWATAILAASVLLGAPAANGSHLPAADVRANGDPGNRVDIAVLGDGYTTGELGRFAADTEAFVSGMFEQEPFNEYETFFNVHRVDVASQESGADHPERVPPLFRETAFDATYNCAGIQRLICVDVQKVLIAAASALEAAERDLLLVLVNDAEYGGSGGVVAVSSVHPAAVEIVLHELGHSFGQLADEYGDLDPACSLVSEPREPNATRELIRERIKWRHWIDPATGVPTLDETDGVPGAYPGGRYCPAGINRPTNNSKMRSLSRPFDQVNSEQLVLRTYSLVSPLDGAEPAEDAITLAAGTTQRFAVRVPSPRTHALAVQWLLDGTPLTTGAETTLVADTLAGGAHTLQVEVSDPKPLVRQDTERLLRATRAWVVHVDAPA